MKTLKEPQEPFCPPFPLPLSPLSRRRLALRFVRSINNSFFLSSRDLMRVFFVPTLSLSLAKQPKREPETTFFGIKKHKKRPLSSTKTVERSLVFFFIFCEHRPDSWHPDKKDTQKPRYLNRN